MNRTLHISSILVHVRPQQLAATAAALERIPGLELHAADPHGKLVVVLEADSERRIVELLDHIQQQPGVLAANMVYHHMESADSLAQELDDGSDAP